MAEINLGVLILITYPLWYQNIFYSIDLDWYNYLF